jgi:magnesium-transporting ATPase (P-type)
VVIVYIYETRVFGSIGEARALAFCSLILANLLLVFSSLSKKRGVLRVIIERNRAALFISGVAVFVLALSILVNPIADLFRFEQPGLLRYWVVVFGGVLFLFYLETIKKIKSGA